MSLVGQQYISLLKIYLSIKRNDNFRNLKIHYHFKQDSLIYLHPYPSFSNFIKRVFHLVFLILYSSRYFTMGILVIIHLLIKLSIVYFQLFLIMDILLIINLLFFILGILAITHQLFIFFTPLFLFILVVFILLVFLVKHSLDHHRKGICFIFPN